MYKFLEIVTVSFAFWFSLQYLNNKIEFREKMRTLWLKRLEIKVLLILTYIGLGVLTVFANIFSLMFFLFTLFWAYVFRVETLDNIDEK